MAKHAGKTEEEKLNERALRHFCRLFEQQGLVVRREKLARGGSYRVKSGDCTFSGENIIFVDRRLPADQQFSLLVDFARDIKLELSDEDLMSLPPQVQTLLTSKGA